MHNTTLNPTGNTPFLRFILGDFPSGLSISLSVCWLMGEFEVYDMKTIEELDSEIGRLLEKQAFDAVKALLSEKTAETGLIKPTEPEIDFWNKVGFQYLQNHMFQQAADLYKALYETQLRGQHERGRLHKGMALHNWGVSVLNLQKRPEAKELITLAYVEDCITSGRNAVEKLGYKTLRNEFSVPDELLNAIFTCATSTRTFDEYPPIDPNVVLNIFRQDEDIWIRQACNNALCNINFDYYNDLLNRTKSARTNDEKRKTLETISEVLFSSIKGFTVLPPVRTSKAEIDRIIRNYSDHPLCAI